MKVVIQKHRILGVKFGRDLLTGDKEIAVIVKIIRDDIDVLCGYNVRRRVAGEPHRDAIVT